ncbi:MAG: TIGR03936 family radical SAM-associated protein [Planctomycetota bacterium]
MTDHGPRSAKRGVTQRQVRYRHRIDFSVDGDVRFLGHRDMLRLFARAVVRAGLAVRYTEGFNPHPRLSIPLPRPAGIASDAECLVIELTEPADEETILARLQAQVPRGIVLARARRLDPQERCLPVKVTYRVALALADRRAVEKRAAVLLDPSPIPVERKSHKTGRVKTLDLRPLIDSITVGDDVIEMGLRVTGSAGARPAEVVAALGLQVDRIRHRIRRLEIAWE